MSEPAPRIAALFDLEPLWKDLAVVAETNGELTPALLPADGDSVWHGRAQARDAAIRAFADACRAAIRALEASESRTSPGLRADWEAWWSVAAPVESGGSSISVTLMKEECKS